MKTLASHVVTAGAAALLASGATYVALGRTPADASTPEAAAAPAPSQAATGDAQQTVLFETTMTDVLGRVASMRELVRAPGLAGTPHRHPGSHTFGYVLEGTYEVQVDDGPVRRLGPGEVFYEYPGALHAVSRNGSATEPVRYLVFQVSDTTLPATVQEP
ncbi:MAG: cupin domain-containing protein [Gemmatimonadetes bacterium]|nr:cupin domain-containing protein [Gemmatimonadota bacterium]